MLKGKKSIFVVVVVLMLSMVVTACSQNTNTGSQNNNEPEKIIRIGTSGRYNPFTFANMDGTLDGFEIDVWNEIGKRMGYKVEYTTAEFSGLFGMLDTDKIDTIANQITMTEQRKEKYLFAQPYVHSGAQLVVKKGNESIKGLEDLKGKKVGVSLGSNYEQMLREYDKNNEISIITYEDFLGSLQDVALGRIDAIVNDKLASIINIEKSGLELQLGGDPVKPLQNAFPFVNNEVNKDLIQRVNKAINEMQNDGTLGSISNKWFKVDITKK